MHITLTTSSLARLVSFFPRSAAHRDQTPLTPKWNPLIKQQQQQTERQVVIPPINHRLTETHTERTKHARPFRERGVRRGGLSFIPLQFDSKTTATQHPFVIMCKRASRVPIVPI
ncbi:uncharacterized protein B0T23DRAFT_389981, partial [Neurospora hispaniola]